MGSARIKNLSYQNHSLEINYNMSIKFKLTTYRIIGSILALFGIIGYLTVADELRHFGEFLGVSCVLVSGLLFLLIDLKLYIFQKFELQWVSICLLASIPFGGIVIDNVPIGICIGLTLGIVLAIIFGNTKMAKSSHSKHDSADLHNSEAN